MNFVYLIHSIELMESCDTLKIKLFKLRMGFIPDRHQSGKEIEVPISQVSYSEGNKS
jgi:hypothetical protein